MKMNRSVAHLLLLMFFCLSGFGVRVQDAGAQTGTYYTRTLTFSKADPATVFLAIKGPIAMGNSTEITVEIGTDNPGSAVSSASLGTLSFVVSNGTSTQTFSGLSSAPDSTTFTNKTVSLTGIDTSGTAPNSTQRYTLQITHNTSVAAATTENWTLTINGFPTSGSPTARAIVSVVSYAGITNLTPFGPSAVAADVVVTPPSGSGTTVTFAASTTNAPAGATYQWVAESTDVNAARQTISTDGRTLTYNLEACTTGSATNCCCRSIAYRFEVRQGTTVFASTRNVYEQKNLSGCSGGGTANVTVEVAVTPPSGTSTTVTFTATAMNAPTGVTYQWTAEGDANAARGTASGNTLTYDLESCAGCCCRNISYRLEVRQGTTVLASNRGVYLQRSLSGCGICTPCACLPCKFVVPVHWPPYKVGPWPPWPWPWPGPGPDPCLSCPLEWKTRIPEDYMRRIIALSPTDETGSLLGPGLKDAIKVNLKDASLIGPLMETRNGEYFAAIEYKKGTNPRVSASVAWKGKTLSTEEISVEPKAKPGWIAWALFALSAFVNIYLVRRQYTQRTQIQRSK